MRILKIVIMAGSALLPALWAQAADAKPVRHSSHLTRSALRPAPYDYGNAAPVMEAFADGYRGRDWRERSGGYYDYGQTDRVWTDQVWRRETVVEDLRGDFTGGVGYGASGFTDGYGQTHFFVGSFRTMAPLPHGPYRPNGFMPRPGPGRRF